MQQYYSSHNCNGKPNLLSGDTTEKSETVTITNDPLEPTKSVHKSIQVM
jgi:hypothetical protein